MREIPLDKGMVALIDDADYELVSGYKWHTVKCGRSWYAFHTLPRDSNGKKKTIRMHRLIMGFPSNVIDHRDHNGLNNQRDNLRHATNAENIKNARKRLDSKQPYKGVEWDKVNRNWVAYICPNSRKKALGRHTTAEAAARAYDAAAILLYGEFAHLNFPLSPHTDL